MSLKVLNTPCSQIEAELSDCQKIKRKKKQAFGMENKGVSDFLSSKKRKATRAKRAEY